MTGLQAYPLPCGCRTSSYWAAGVQKAAVDSAAAPKEALLPRVRLPPVCLLPEILRSPSMIFRSKAIENPALAGFFYEEHRICNYDAVGPFVADGHIVSLSRHKRIFPALHPFS